MITRKQYERVKYLLEHSELSHLDIANTVGISQHSVYRISKGKLDKRFTQKHELIYTGYHCPVCGGKLRIKRTLKPINKHNMVRKVKECQDCLTEMHTVEFAIVGTIPEYVQKEFKEDTFTWKRDLHDY